MTEMITIIAVGVGLAGLILNSQKNVREQIDQRLDQMDARFEKLEVRLEKLEARMGTMERQLARIVGTGFSPFNPCSSIHPFNLRSPLCF